MKSKIFLISILAALIVSSCTFYASTPTDPNKDKKSNSSLSFIGEEDNTSSVSASNGEHNEDSSTNESKDHNLNSILEKGQCDKELKGLNEDGKSIEHTNRSKEGNLDLEEFTKEFEKPVSLNLNDEADTDSVVDNEEHSDDTRDYFGTDDGNSKYCNLDPFSLFGVSSNDCSEYDNEYDNEYSDTFKDKNLLTSEEAYSLLNKDYRDQLGREHTLAIEQLNARNASNVENKEEKQIKKLVIGQGEEVITIDMVRKILRDNPGPVSLEVSRTVKRINDGAFSVKDSSYAGGNLANSENIKEIIMHDGIETIGKLAFAGCESLVELNIPKTVKDIGGAAFSMCKSIKELDLPDSITEICDGLCSGCTSLEKVHIHDDVVRIGEASFNDCSALKEIKLPVNIECIGNRAFFACTSLVKIKLPNKIEVIGDNTFFKCESLMDVYIGENVKKICKGAFSNCISIKKISIPDDIESIDDYAFRNCRDLEVVSLFKSNKVCEDPNNKLEEKDNRVIGRDVFSCCIKLRIVEIPNGIRKFGENTFKENDNLEEVIIGDSIIEIPDEVFSEKHYLKKVIIGKSVQKIGYKSFANCNSLTSINLPSNLKEIGEGAFIFTNLKSVYVPKSVTTILDNAFDLRYNVKPVKDADMYITFHEKSLEATPEVRMIRGKADLFNYFYSRQKEKSRPILIINIKKYSKSVADLGETKSLLMKSFLTEKENMFVFNNDKDCCAAPIKIGLDLNDPQLAYMDVTSTNDTFNYDQAWSF